MTRRTAPGVAVSIAEWNMPTSEKQFMSQVVELARLCHWAVYHTRDSRGSTAGFPDLVLLRGDQLVICEIKTMTGRLTTAQASWLSALRLVPGISVFLWRPDDWPAIERVLTAPRS